MNFEWDSTKNERNIEKHGIDFDDAIALFEGDYFEDDDNRKDYGERRVRVVGMIDDLLIFLVYTPRGDTRRIISARRANEQDRKRYRSALAQRAAARTDGLGSG